MVTEARKRANVKWDKENMTILGCRVRKDFAEQFKAACTEAGTTSNAVLKQAAEDFLKDHPADTVPNQPSATATPAGDTPDDDTETRRAALLEQIKGL